MRPPFLQVYAKKVFRPEVDIFGGGKAFEASAVYVKMQQHSRQKEGLTVCAESQKHISVQIVHIIHFLENMYMDAKLFKKCLQFLLLK